MPDIPTTYADDPTAAQGPFRLNPPGETGGLEPVQPLAAPGTALAIPQLEQLEQRRQQAIGARQTELDREASDLAQAYRNRPQTPTLGRVSQPAPDAQDFQKNTMTFFAGMALLGALMPGISRGAGNAALNAFAGALNGWHSGNLEAYENATKQWEQNTKAMIENNNFLIKQYDMELQNTALNIEQMQANIKLKAAQFHDTIAYNNSENTQVLAQYRDKLDKANRDVGAAAEPFIAQRRKEESQQALLGERVASGEIDPEGLDPRTGQPYTTAQKQMLNYTRQQYLAGFYDRGKGGGRGSTTFLNRQQFIDEYTAEHGVPPTLAQITAMEAERAAEISQSRKVGTQAGGIAIAVQTLKDTIPNVEQLAKENAGRGFAVWSNIEARWKVQKGDEGFAEYVQQLNTLTNQYARVIANGYKPTNDQINHARESGGLTPNVPYSAFLGSMKGIKFEVGVEEAAPGKVLARLRGEAPAATTTAPQSAAMSAEDELALGWARANPNDPRAGKILQKLGIQ